MDNTQKPAPAGTGRRRRKRRRKGQKPADQTAQIANSSSSANGKAAGAENASSAAQAKAETSGTVSDGDNGKSSGNKTEGPKNRRRRRRRGGARPTNAENIQAPDQSKQTAEKSSSAPSRSIENDRHGSQHDVKAGHKPRPKTQPWQPRGEPTDQPYVAHPSYDSNRQKHHGSFRRVHRSPAYAALDLGTNNCRLLVAIPDGHSFRVIDAFSRIVRLGEGIAHSGKLSDDAMDRAVGALRICNNKLTERGIKRRRLIATEACRVAENGEHFIARVLEETGLELEIVNRETEARLAVSGCASLIDRRSDGAILFDIGGGSSELVWLDLNDPETKGQKISKRIRSWTSLPVGVVNISERHGGGKNVTREIFEDMVSEVDAMLKDFPQAEALGAAITNGNMHLLGTSGTVTTLAGLHLGLRTYDRRKVDGIWMQADEVDATLENLLEMSFEQRVRNNCIGAERADLVMGGCAILEAIRRKWPCDRLRVADRGLREGILYELMSEDGVLRSSGRKKNYFRGRKPQRNDTTNNNTDRKE